MSKVWKPLLLWLCLVSSSTARAADEFRFEAVVLSASPQTRSYELALAPVLILERILEKMPPGASFTADLLFQYAELCWDIGTEARLELAERTFALLIRDYPEWQRIDEVLFSAAFLSAQFGKRTETRALLVQLVREHPKSPLAREVAPLVALNVP